MIVIEWRWLYERVFTGYAGTSVFIFCFVKNRHHKRTINHELIHMRQQVELLFVGFYVLYLIEFLIRLIILRNATKAYMAILFEKEAYGHQDNFRYHTERENYAWLKYFKK